MTEPVSKKPPVAWTIAGSDASGGAGLQADLRAFAAFGVHAGTVVTAVTAQNRDAFTATEAVSANTVRAQINALLQMQIPAAIKIGMLGTAANAKEVATFTSDTTVPVILDPLLRASSGGELADPATVAILCRELLPRADLVTPNIPEAEQLTGIKISTPFDMVKAAAHLCASGARRVLIKGGHLSPGPLAVVADYVSDGTRSYWLYGPRQQTTARGTGCAFASAVAANLARGLAMDDAIVVARAHINRGLRLKAADPVETHGILPQPTSPVTAADMPWITLGDAPVTTAADRPQFASCGPEPLGFYPIVDRASWIPRLSAQGVTTVQLRVKDLHGASLASEIAAAVAAARTNPALRLFINDHWELALKSGAYGVHLGQEDLAGLDSTALPKVAKAGLRLGISTHSYFEAAVAHGLRPSYVALGPIFATTCKSMRFGPQGFPRLAEWHSLLPYPIVAIGGLTFEHAAVAVAHGADGIAVISDLSTAPNPDARAHTWVTELRAGPRRVP